MTSIPTTMRVAALTGMGEITLMKMPVPIPGPGQVLVRLRAVGICGSDVHYYADGRIGDAVATFPFVLGHEPAGEVAAVGDGVTALRAGDRVAIEPALPCGQCPICATGRPNCCPEVRFLGTPPIPGVFAEYAALDARQCVPLPSDVSFEEAATLEPMAVGVHAVNLARVRPGDRVAIMGCGPVGILTAMAARAAGAAFIAMTDPLPTRRAHAATLGADLVLDPDAADTVPRIRMAAGEIDVAFEAAGEQAAIDDATHVARPGGTAVIIGIPAVDRITLDAHPVRRKELQLIFARRSNFTLEPCIRLLECGRIAPRAVITHRFALDQLAEGMALARQHRDRLLKAVVVMP